jgi:hypothetical protein
MDEQRTDVRRIRLIASLSIYGAALGIAALLISLLAQTKFPNEPEHMDFVPSLVISSSGAVAGAVLAGLITFWTVRDPGKPRNIFVLAFIGFGFGVFLPFTTGLLLPLGTLLLNITYGVVRAGEVPSQFVSAVFQGPSFAFVHGVFGLFTGMLAGALFAVGWLIIDWTNVSGNSTIARFGPYAAAVILSATVLAITAFGSAPALAKLG